MQYLGDPGELVSLIIFKYVKCKQPFCSFPVKYKKSINFIFTFIVSSSISFTRYVETPALPISLFPLVSLTACTTSLLNISGPTSSGYTVVPSCRLFISVSGNIHLCT